MKNNSFNYQSQRLIGRSSPIKPKQKVKTIELSRHTDNINDNSLKTKTMFLRQRFQGFNQSKNAIPSSPFAKKTWDEQRILMSFLWTLKGQASVSAEAQGHKNHQIVQSELIRHHILLVNSFSWATVSMDMRTCDRKCGKRRGLYTVCRLPCQ